ncbi:glycosyltransferase family 117 protein [Maribellus mangrovi]|uniref:glycosyltransferase family 117 protein n=1 Tax=Maribellus mangrovi TaxID=3133146 RepID=UPI0030ED5E93
MKKQFLVRYSGIGIFLFALVLYILTLEPTTSFWDCSEFILSANKLEVNHPAGAPLFMLIGRLFTLLSFGNPERIAWTINFSSGVFSALTIFFLFHVIVKLVKRFSANTLAIVGSGALGALTFSVSDSFWFSAVEGEVYALSMFFMIVSFWAALKWEEGYGDPGNEKWILFLALLTGLGIGVHLLNLLVLPSVVMIVGLKKKKYSPLRMLLFFGIGVLALLTILYVLTPLVMQTLARFDFVFVNRLGLPLHSGTLAGVVFFMALFTFLIRYFRKHNKKVAELATLSVALVLVGFSVYAVNIIRSSANPPVNFGRPSNIYSLIDYLNREQYPKRPLLYGQNYNSPITGSNERLSKDFLEGKYRDIDLAPSYEYDDRTCTWFPRMSSRDDNHVKAYNNWVNIKGKRISVRQGNGERETLVVPTFSENLKFFVNYQFAYMFGRYFMWNFAGRQNDRQGRGDVVEGNWLSGINFIDEARLGPQENLPDWLSENESRNAYYFIPLLIGLVGAWFHFKKHRPGFYVVLALFIMGGLGLTVYINEIPVTPRERDYVFVVAFLAFSIWVGMGFWALSELLKRLLQAKMLTVPLLILLLLIGPGIMLWQNFDDHDRSGRTAARDFAMNILESCPPNAILVSSGDNDTYPLLYCQEVENFRTDVRIVIAPFLSANWFIDGLRKQKYEDAGLKMTLPQQKYDRGELDFVPVLDRLKRDTSWQEALNFLKMEKDQAKVRLNSGQKVNFIPLKEMSFTLKTDDTTGEIDVSLKDKNFLYKNELVMWDIISSNASERPICFVSKAEAQKYKLDRNLECEGFVYRLVTEKSQRSDILSIGRCEPEKLYARLMNDYRFGNLADPAVHVDWNSVLNVSLFRGRNVFNEVAALLLQNGEKQMAADLLAKSSEVFPLAKIPYDVFSLRQTQLMVEAGMQEEAQQQFAYLEDEIVRSLNYFSAIPPELQRGIRNDKNNQLYYLNNLVMIASQMGDKEKSQELKKRLEQFVG